MNLSTKNWRLKKNSKLLLSKQSHSQAQCLTFTNSSVKKTAARWIGFQQAAAVLKTRMEAARIHHSLTQLTVFSWSVQRKTTCFCKSSFWQREKDSNPHKQSQSLSCYPYTIPLFLCFSLRFVSLSQGQVLLYQTFDDCQ